MIKYENEHKYLDFFKNEKCGLRWLCTKCTDPFEHWFYQELPRRVYYEPEWTFFGLPYKKKESASANAAHNSEIDQLVVKMREQYAEDEKKRGKKNKKTLAESWGFRKAAGPQKKPAEFVCGEDFDDLEALVGDGKHLNVKMQNFVISDSEWIHSKSQGPKTSSKKKLVGSKVERQENKGIVSSIVSAGKAAVNMLSFGQTEEVPEPSPDDSNITSMSMEEFSKRFGVHVMSAQVDGQLIPKDEKINVEFVDLRKVMEEMEKSGVNPFSAEFLLNEMEKKKAESVKNQQGGNNTEKNRKKKEKKKNKKIQKDMEKEQARNMV